MRKETTRASVCLGTNRLTSFFSGSSVVFDESHLGDYSDFLSYLESNSLQGRALPAVHLFLARYSLRNTTRETTRKALDMTISVEKAEFDFVDLDRLELSQMLLSSHERFSSVASHLSFVEEALVSSTASSFRSSRIYSRVILRLLTQQVPGCHHAILEKASVSERLLYALVDLDADGIGDSRYGLPLRNMLEEAFSRHFSDEPIYNIVKTLYDDHFERLHQMQTTRNSFVLSYPIISDRILQ